MLATFGEVKESNALNISGVTADSAAFRDLVNEATRRLLRRGDWPGTVVPMFLCVYGGCVVWPAFVGEIRKLNICRGSLALHNQWYEFIERNCWQSNCGTACAAIDTGRSPVFADIYGDNRYPRFYATHSQDLGKTITIFGIDTNNQPLQTWNGTIWSDGIPLALASPYVQSPTTVRRIDRVLKQRTQGRVNGFSWNATASVLEPLAIYESWETNPSFVRQKVNLGTCASGSCTDPQSVLALVKLKFVPVLSDNDVVLIENLDALKDFMQSIRFREGADNDSANTFEASAIRELNLSMHDRDGEDKITVDAGFMTHAGVGAQSVF